MNIACRAPKLWGGSKALPTFLELQTAIDFKYYNRTVGDKVYSQVGDSHNR